MPVVNRQTAKPANKQAAPKGGVLSRIRSVQEEADRAGIKMCIYGQSGKGKTTLWSSFPKPILAAIASGAGETRSIRNVKDIQAVALEDEAELADLVKMQRTTGKYATVVLDHATGYQDLLMKKVLQVSTLPAQMGWGSATQQNWGDVAAGAKERFRDLLSLDCNVVIVCQEREFNTENNSDLLMPYVSTALSPSITGWLGPNVDYLVQMFIRLHKMQITRVVGGQKVTDEKETIQYCARTGPHPVYATKFRIPKGTPLPDAVVDPDYNKLIALIEGKG